MASVQYLFSFSRTFTRELITAQIHLAEATALRIPNVVIIQKTWRGYVAWKKYQHVRKAIITIQSFFRGWKVRKNRAHYEAQHEEDVGNMRLIRAATKIQAWWRGLQERKYLRFKGVLASERIKDRKRIQEQSEQMAQQLRKMFEENEYEKRHKKEAAEQQEALVILYKCHHLLRTHQREGIYSCHGSNKLSVIERLMKALPCQEYMNNIHQLYKELMKVKKNAEAIANRNKSEAQKCREEALAKHVESKPKLVIKKGRNLHDKPFILSSKIKEKPYIPSVITNDIRREKLKDPFLTKKEKGFVLNPKNDLIEREEPYYIDYWEKEVFSDKKAKISNTPIC